MPRLFVALVLALSMSACDGGTSLPTAPTATPTATAPPSPPVIDAAAFGSGSIAGLVFEATETGPRPIADVELYCDACGELGHTLTHTDANGLYSFTGGVWRSRGVTTTLRVLKEGFEDPPGLVRGPFTPTGPGWREVSVDGDTQFDIELVRR